MNWICVKAMCSAWQSWHPAWPLPSHSPPPHPPCCPPSPPCCWWRACCRWPSPLWSTSPHSAPGGSPSPSVCPRCLLHLSILFFTLWSLNFPPPAFGRTHHVLVLQRVLIGDEGEKWDYNAKLTFDSDVTTFENVRWQQCLVLFYPTRLVSHDKASPVG